MSIELLELAESLRVNERTLRRAWALGTVRGERVSPYKLRVPVGEREVLDLIFLPGLTTAPAVTSEVGRGVGMDVVRTNVSRLGGEIEVQTAMGRGTRREKRVRRAGDVFTMTLTPGQHPGEPRGRVRAGPPDRLGAGIGRRPPGHRAGRAGGR